MNKQDIKKLVHAVDTYCQGHNIRFTDPRRHVLEIIAAADRPIGAYDILDRLGERLPSPKPPTAYRAIEFLQEHGFVHRIESLNAYVICYAGHLHEGSQFMICDSCGKATETHLCTLPSPLRDKAGEAGFTVTRWSAEIHGTCRACTGG